MQQFRVTVTRHKSGVSTHSFPQLEYCTLTMQPQHKRLDAAARIAVVDAVQFEFTVADERN
jgi:hypothetical protein